MEIHRNEIPSKSSTAEEVVEQIKLIDEQLKTAKGIDRIKLTVKKTKLVHELSSTDFKTY